MPSQTTALPTLYVRLPAALHEACVRMAKADGVSLNTWVLRILEGITRAEWERLSDTRAGGG